jgi:hypothetical protein
VHARKQAILIEDPVEDGVREHRIDGFVEVELREVRAPHRGALGGSALRACATISSEVSTAITRPRAADLAGAS